MRFIRTLFYQHELSNYIRNNQQRHFYDLNDKIIFIIKQATGILRYLTLVFCSASATDNKFKF